MLFVHTPNQLLFSLSKQGTQLVRVAAQIIFFLFLFLVVKEVAPENFTLFCFCVLLFFFQSQYVFLHHCIMDYLQSTETDAHIYENVDTIYVNATALKTLQPQA